MVGSRALVLCLGLGACAAVPDAPGGGAVPPGPVTTEAAFRAVAVGRDLVAQDDGAVLRVAANGSWLERRANHIVASGIWDWSGARWCHEGRRDGRLFARDCADVVAEGAVLRLGGRALRRD